MTLHNHPEKLACAVALLKALANSSRLHILFVLRSCGEKNVSELEQIIGLSQSALSQHLARLRKDKLVTTRRQAQTIFYAARQTKADHVLDALSHTYAPLTSSVDRVS